MHAYFRIVLTAVFTMIMGFSGAATAAGIDEESAREDGREIVQTLLAGDAASLWPRIGAPLQGLIGDAGALAGMAAQLGAQFGPEQELLGEELTMQAGGFHYRRVARHGQGSAPLAVDVHVDQAGIIQGLQIAPEPDFDTGDAPAVGEGELPDDVRLQALLDGFVASGGAPGVVLGVIDAGGRRVLVAGNAGDGSPPDADTVFDAGSITKGLTGLLLAQMIASGEVRADQPIGSLFPEDVALSALLASITLEELATHHSGLPRISRQLAARAARSPLDPYAGSTVDDIFGDVAALDDESVAAVRGSFAYSNLGSALLGQLLARAVQDDFETALAGRVFAELDLPAPLMDPGASAARDAIGHSQGSPVPAWQLDAYAPAGAWRASTTQMLDLAQRLLGDDPAWVSDALRERASADGEGIGFAWLHGRVKHREIIWHNGGTGGFRSFLTIVPAESLAVVVLANGTASVDELALAIIDPGD